MITIEVWKRDGRIVARWRRREAEGDTAEEALSALGAELDRLVALVKEGVRNGEESMGS